MAVQISRGSPEANAPFSSSASRKEMTGLQDFVISSLPKKKAGSLSRPLVLLSEATQYLAINGPPKR